MADEHRSDDEVLADLERSLTDEDPGLSDQLTSHTTRYWPTRALTLTWLIWTGTWFITYLTTHNPASLILATTSALIYPAGLGALTWWNRHTSP